MTLTSSKINLQWDAPLYVNGIIEKYEVVLQVTKEKNSNYSKNYLTSKVTTMVSRFERILVVKI